MKVIQYITVIVSGLAISFAIGYRIGASGELTFSEGIIYTEEGIGILRYGDDFDTIDQIFHYTEVEGISITGAIVSITPQDVSEIKNEMKKIEGLEPILSFRVISGSHVEVETGEIRGPLDGGGRVYVIKKNKGEWEVDLTVMKHWISKKMMRTSRLSQFLSRSALQS